MSDKACARTELLIGRAGVTNLAARHCLVAGLGGVGGHCAETLVRAGIGNITLIDKSVITESNLNRQIIALHSTLGRDKVEVMCERLLDINPELNIQTHRIHLNEHNVDELVGCPSNHGRYDAIADCIDTIACKASLIAVAQQQQIPIISALGAGGRLDPSQIRRMNLPDTHSCGLARALRKRLRRMGCDINIPVVFSDETPTKGISADVATNEGDTRHAETTNGAIAHIPALFGLMMAGHMIQNLLKPTHAKA